MITEAECFIDVDQIKEPFDYDIERKSFTHKIMENILSHFSCIT